MTTVLQVINQSLRDANIIGEGDTASGDQASEALALFNQMLALWQTDNLHIYAQRETSFSPNGALSYTVGTGGNVNTTRPTKVDALFWRSGGVDSPITLIDTYEQYQSIAIKTQAGEALYAFYLPSYPLGTLYLTPQTSTGTVHLITQAVLPATSALADTLILPPEYILPIRSNLTVLLCGSYGSPIRPSVAATAASGLRLLKRSNLRIQPLGMPAGVPVGSRSNIISGE